MGKIFLGRRDFLRTSAVVTVGALATPSLLRAASDPIIIGHLTPRTGPLGPLGDLAVMAQDLAVEQINVAGGVSGRQIKLIKEDSMNPQTATTKAERLIERDKAVMIIGEASSASALSISQVCQRANKIFINTGANSDFLRGKDCKRIMFHTEIHNIMNVNAVGQYFLDHDMVKGKKWYMLSADYSFGHDLRNGAMAFLKRNGGATIGDELIPTDTTDYSSYLLKIRAAKPDLIILNLAGAGAATFFKQYGEFGMDIPLGGFDYNSAFAWAAGIENFKGTWPCIWTHQIKTEGSQAFVKAFKDRYGKPPENQAYTDYIATHIAAQAIKATGGTDTETLIAYFENPATEFDILKARKGRFDPGSHQLLQEMYTVTAVDPKSAKNEWDIFTTSDPVPGPNDDLADLRHDAVGGVCQFT